MTDEEINTLDRRQGKLEVKLAVMDEKLDNLTDTFKAHIVEDSEHAKMLFQFLAGLSILNLTIVIENLDKLVPIIKLFL